MLYAFNSDTAIRYGQTRHTEEQKERQAEKEMKEFLEKEAEELRSAREMEIENGTGVLGEVLRDQDGEVVLLPLELTHANYATTREAPVVSVCFVTNQH